MSNEIKKINVLGTEYTLHIKKYDEDETFDRLGFCGYCDYWVHEIIVCDMTTYKGWEHEPFATAEAAQNQTIRHEIVHAFLSESGLLSSHTSNNSWAKDEEVIDWFAAQGAKIYAAWEEAGAI